MIEQVGFGLTVVVAEFDPVHPLPSLTVTVNVFAVFTMTHCVVAPVLQLYKASPAGAHICVELPWQNVSVPLMDGVGFGFTISVLLQLLLHPDALVTVTVKVPAAFVVMH